MTRAIATLWKTFANQSRRRAIATTCGKTWDDALEGDRNQENDKGDRNPVENHRKPEQKKGDRNFVDNFSPSLQQLQCRDRKQEHARAIATPWINSRQPHNRCNAAIANND